MKNAGRLAGVVALAACVVAVAGATRADATRSSGTGAVLVETTLGYEGGRAAGTGIVLTPTGEILTNNHVIRGATAVKVVVPGGRSYPARVVGYDLGHDVALLRLRNASHLKTAALGAGTALRIGQLVTATGNAGGGGRLRRVDGQITGLSRAITASDGEGDSERLTGLVETSAHVVPGDSGGPLEDTGGRVIGMVTAASGADFAFLNVSVSDGYAVPIGKALAAARAIATGTSRGRIHVGPTAFLGVSVAAGAPGAVVAGVAAGTPAAQAGLQPGDVIVGVGGRPVRSANALRSALLLERPGRTVQIVYHDGSGASRTVTATLASGPPQ